MNFGIILSGDTFSDCHFFGSDEDKTIFICQQAYRAKHEIDSYIFIGRNHVKMNLCAEKRRGEPLKMVAFSST